jgi:hypothetical protein
MKLFDKIQEKFNKTQEDRHGDNNSCRKDCLHKWECVETTHYENVESSKDVELCKCLKCGEERYWSKKVNDRIWWVESRKRKGGYSFSKEKGEQIFSFDKIKEFSLFRDYPYTLTQEQKEIFDKENPYWANFFKDRI